MPYSTGESSAASEPLWKPLRLFNFYRVAIAGVLLIIMLAGPRALLGQHNPDLFIAINALYVFLSLCWSWFNHYRWPRFEIQVFVAALIDVCAIALLMHASGGIASGLGMLMIAAVAGASLLTTGRFALGVAALGTLALLAAQAYADLHGSFAESAYTQTGLLGASLFITAWLAITLSQRARRGEALAARRGIDLADMAEVNGLIVNRMQSGIVVVDDGARVQLINRAARTLLGHAAADSPIELRALSHPLYRLFLGWLRNHDNAQPRKLQHGHATTLQARFMRLGARREDRGAVIYIENIAEINRQIQETKLASLSRLTASIAHEIRNPLGAISHAAQLLGESPKLDAADQRMVNMIQEHSRRMNAIIHDVLRLYRKEQPNPETIPLKSWLEQFTAQFSRDHGIAPDWISIRISAPDACVRIDPNHLHQVLWNLCVNALNYGRDPGGAAALVLTGGHTADEPAPYLDVIDRGPGIAAELQAQLFEPFVTSSTQGTGLGLFIARELCQANGGDLSFVPNPGGGSCFRIQFAGAPAQLQVHPTADQGFAQPQLQEHSLAASAYR